MAFHLHAASRRRASISSSRGARSAGRVGPTGWGVSSGSGIARSSGRGTRPCGRGARPCGWGGRSSLRAGIESAARGTWGRHLALAAAARECRNFGRRRANPGGRHCGGRAELPGLALGRSS